MSFCPAWSKSGETTSWRPSAVTRGDISSEHCSARLHIDEEADGFIGGFGEARFQELLGLLDSNHMGWPQIVAR